MLASLVRRNRMYLLQSRLGVPACKRVDDETPAKRPRLGLEGGHQTGMVVAIGGA